MANRKGGGRGGRKPKPTALKVADGTRADRIPVGEPAAPGGAPERPDWLDAFALEGWDRLTAAAGRLNLLSPVDADAVGIFAEAYSRWRRARLEVERDGLTIEGAHGGRTTHPAVGIAERAERIMLSTLALFGLSPSDRSRLRATDTAAADPFDEFLRQGV